MVVVLAHGDADGICSASLILARYPQAKIKLSRPISIVSDLSQHQEEDLVFVLDIAINPDKKDALERLSKKMRERLVYIDHHALQLSGRKAPAGKSSTEMTWDAIGAELPQEMLLLASIGAIADYLPGSLAAQAYERWSKEVVDLQSSILSLGIEASRTSFKLALVEELSHGRTPTQIPALVRKALRAVTNQENLASYVRNNLEKKGKITYVENPPTRGMLGRAAMLCIAYGKTPVGVCGQKTDGDVDISVRSEKLDIGTAVMEAAMAVGGSGGGHAHAAGGTLPLGKLKPFIAELDRRL